MVIATCFSLHFDLPRDVRISALLVMSICIRRPIVYLRKCVYKENMGALDSLSCELTRELRSLCVRMLTLVAFWILHNRNLLFLIELTYSCVQFVVTHSILIQGVVSVYVVHYCI